MIFLKKLLLTFYTNKVNIIKSFKNIFIILTLFINISLYSNTEKINNSLPNEKEWIDYQILKPTQINEFDNDFLSLEEKLWIKQNPKIKVIEFFDEFPFTINTQKKTGYIYELLEYLAKSVGLQIEYIKGISSYDKMLEVLNNNEVDILTTFPTSLKLEKDSNILPLSSILKTPFVLIGNTSSKKVNSIEELYGKKIAVVKGYIQDKYLSKFPQVEKVYVYNNNEGFDFIREGKAEFYINNRANSEYILNKTFSTDLKIVYQLPYDSFPSLSLSFALNKNNEQLVSIFKKAHKEIPFYKIKSIKEKWLVKKVNENKFNNKQKNKSIIGLLIVCIGLFIFLLLILIVISKFISNDFVAKRFGSLKFKFISLLILSIVVFMLAFLVFLTLRENKRNFLQSIKTDLEFVLKNTQNRLEKWIEEHKLFLIQIVKNEEFIDKTKALLNVNIHNLKKSPELIKMREYFKKREEFGSLDFFIINEDFINIGSNIDDTLGIKNFIANQKPELIKEVFKGKTLFFPLLINENINKVKEHKIFFLVPIKDKKNKIIAAMIQKLDIEGKISEIVRSGQLGKTGESYIFSKDGFMLTKSRFELDLIKIGILKQDEKLELIDPGENFLESSNLNLSKDKLPLTKMAANAIILDRTLMKHSEILFDMEGYRDYRGVVVFGAWIWYNKYSIGLSTEIDEGEALSEFYTLRQNLIIITTLTLLLTVMAVLMLLILGEKATKSIKKANDKLNKLLELFDDNVIALKTDRKGIITYTSKAFCKINGYAQKELIGISQNIIRHHDMPKELYKDLWKTIINGKIWRGEIKNKKKDGSFYWVDIVVEPEFINKQSITGFSIIMQDITSKKEVQELSENLEIKVEERTKELEDQKQYINSIMNSQSSMVISTNGEKLLSANKAFFDFFKVKNVSEFYSNFGDCICDTFDIEASEGFIQKTMGKEKWIEYVYARPDKIHKVQIVKDNQIYIFSITSDHFEFAQQMLKVAVFTNITKIENIRKNIETILSNIMLPILITSKKKEILYANESASIHYELPVNELIGSNINSIYFNANKSSISSLIEKKGFIEKYENKYKTRNGKEFVGLLSVKPIVYGEEEAYISMVVDITKQKKIEHQIRQMHEHTQASIKYASLIQGSLIPDNKLFREYFKEYFTIWHPKDIVGGDIYLFEELRNNDECILMVIDCTGHGVPGAFVTMLVKAIERQIIAKISNNDNFQVSPAWCLQYFNKSIKKLLQQEDNNSISNVGFDGQILYYNKKQKIIKCASAKNEIFYVQNDEVKRIKADRYSVGYKDSDNNFEFKEHIIDVSIPTTLYISSDGYWDQLGGEKQLSFGKKRLQELIEKIKDEPLAEQQEEFIYTLAAYQADLERQDDITFIGLRI